MCGIAKIPSLARLPVGNYDSRTTTDRLIWPGTCSFVVRFSCPSKYKFHRHISCFLELIRRIVARSCLSLSIIWHGFGHAIRSLRSCISLFLPFPSLSALLPPLRCPFGSPPVLDIKASQLLVQHDVPHQAPILPTGPSITILTNSRLAKSLSFTLSPLLIPSMTRTTFIASTPAPRSALIGPICRPIHQA